MRRSELLNLAALLLALAASLAAVLLLGRQPAETAADGPVQAVVTDRGGHRLPVRAYARIASASMIGDAALLACAAPERVVAFSAYTRGPLAVRLGAKPRLEGLDDLEAILRLRPDLVIVSSWAGAQDEKMARLREAGVVVCDLGPMDGLASCCAGYELVGALCAAPELGRFAADELRRQAAGVAAASASAARPRALVVTAIGDSLFGGTAGTSYQDVLQLANCRDVAAEAGLSQWPQYSVERLIALDPEVMVTKRGMADRLRTIPGHRARVVELDGDVLEDPGPLVPEAAASLRAELDRR